MGERLHKREKKKETSKKKTRTRLFSHIFAWESLSIGLQIHLPVRMHISTLITVFYCCILFRFRCLFVYFRSFMVLSVSLFLVWVLLRNIARLDSRESIEKCDRRRLCKSARSWKLLTKGKPCTRQFSHPFANTCPSNKHNFPSCVHTCAANRFVSSIAECLLCDVAKPCFPQRTTTCAPFL